MGTVSGDGNARLDRVLDLPLHRFAMRLLGCPPIRVEAFSQKKLVCIVAHWRSGMIAHYVRWSRDGELTRPEVNEDREVIQNTRAVPKTHRLALAGAKRLAFLLTDPVFCLGVASGLPVDHLFERPKRKGRRAKGGTR